MDDKLRVTVTLKRARRTHPKPLTEEELEVLRKVVAAKAKRLRTSYKIETEIWVD